MGRQAGTAGQSNLTLEPDRTITLTRPDGTTAFTGSTIDVAPTGTHDGEPAGATQPVPVRPVDSDTVELRMVLGVAVAAAGRRHRHGPTGRPPPAA